MTAAAAGKAGLPLTLKLEPSATSYADELSGATSYAAELSRATNEGAFQLAEGLPPEAAPTRSYPVQRTVHIFIYDIYMNIYDLGA